MLKGSTLKCLLHPRTTMVHVNVRLPTKLLRLCQTTSNCTEQVKLADVNCPTFCSQCHPCSCQKNISCDFRSDWVSSYLFLICRPKKVRRLVRKPHLQELVPRLAEKRTWMHLVQEIMIMEMNLMTLCDIDSANQVHRIWRIWNSHGSAQICQQRCGMCCFLSSSQHLCFVINIKLNTTQELSIFIK